MNYFLYVFYGFWGLYLLLRRETCPIPYLQLILLVSLAVLAEVR